MLEHILQAIGIKGSAAIGGMVGALISLKFAEGLTIKSKFLMFLCGMSLAGYTTPLAAHFFSIGSDYFGGIGLLIGLFGMALVSAIIKSIPDLVRKYGGG